MWLRRVASGLLAGYQRQAPAAAAALQRACGFGSSGGPQVLDQVRAGEYHSVPQPCHLLCLRCAAHAATRLSPTPASRPRPPRRAPWRPQLETQPFSTALKQLEAALSDPGLPPEALAANSKALVTLREFARNLSPPGGGYPRTFAKRVEVVFR